MANARSEDFVIKNVRLSYPNLYKAQVKDDGKKQYNATLLFSKADTANSAVLKKAVMDVISKQWGDKGLPRWQQGLIKNPVLDGDGPQGLNKKSGARHAGYEGNWFIRASANEDRPPRLYTRSLTIAGPDDIYAGCYVNAVINAFAWSNPKNGDGVSFGLTYVQFAAPGERLGGGAPPVESLLEKIADEGAAPVQTQGGAGAGGFFS